MEVVPSTPQERVQEQIMDFVPHIKETFAGKVKCTGKVFTVPHHRDDLACTLDTVGLLIKGLDKFNLPRVGDVMVPAPQITNGIVGHVEQVVSWFDRKILGSSGRAFVPLSTKAPGPEQPLQA